MYRINITTLFKGVHGMDHVRKRAISVLGMHRSGTSAITRSINILGVEIGDKRTMYKPQVDNPKGFWEQEKIGLLNDIILENCGSDWDKPNLLKDEWWKSSDILPYKYQLIEMIVLNYANYDLWVWKDPRTSILLPLWKDVLNELQIDVDYVICIRNPLDVYKSLEIRNGFTLEKSTRLWLIYTLSALFWTQNRKRVIIHFEDFINRPAKTLQFISMFLELPNINKNKVKILNSFVKKKLKHHNSTFDHVMNNQKISNDVKELYSLIFHTKNFNNSNFNKKVINLYSNITKNL